MKFMKSKLYASNKTVLLFTIIYLALSQNITHAYQAKDFSWIPPFQAQQEKPSISIIFDSSGSMHTRAFTGKNFNSTTEYYGYFDEKKYYKYDEKKYYFYETSDIDDAWNGNFLNWATTLRIDAAKKVMAGGDYDEKDGVLKVTKISSSFSLTIDDENPITDLNGETRHITPFHEKNLEIQRIAYQRNITVKNNNYELRIKQDKKYGVIHKFKDLTRMSLFFYDEEQGGLIQEYMSEDSEKISKIAEKINTLYPNTWTPLAETLFTVTGYIKQDNKKGNYGPRYSDNSYNASITTDPFYFEKFNDTAPCTKQNIIFITDGESTKDKNIPSSLQNLVTRPHTYSFSSDGSSYLLDIAYHGHTTDLRPDLPGKQTFDLYTVFAFGSGSTLLSDATMYGSFKDKNDDGLPQPSEYDEDNDGVPDNYFEASTGQELESAITAAFDQATRQVASGTAAAVTAQTRSGEGAAYQAIFFPPTNATTTAPDWSGQVHALLIDKDGNYREDTNGNQKLDYEIDGSGNYIDRIVRYINGEIRLYTKKDTYTTAKSILELKHLWSSTTWLNSMTDSEAAVQRVDYEINSNNRYIITFADINNNMIADTGEIQNFALPSIPGSTTIGDKAYFYNYLTLYDAKSMSLDLNPADPIQNLKNTDPDKYKSFLAERAKLQVEFIRGVEVADNTIEGITDTVRSRKHGTNTWRLGNILYSSPTLVAAPAENYHMIYDDKSYEDFARKYRHRRHVIYAGANDGMIHAFNGGFYNTATIGFDLKRTSETEYPLGMELWAYAPYSLLPHLRWLMNSKYGAQLHVPYMDLEPRIFDARIFFTSDGVTPIDNATYPNGWGTVLVAGMRLGGSKIQADLDKNGIFDGDDRTMTSSYVIIDITNPEKKPNVIAEINMPGLGFTTCFPTAMPMTLPNAAIAKDNSWFLVFGSGPANSAGEAHKDKLGTFTSDQAGRLFVLDLSHLYTQKKIRTLDKDGNFVEGHTYFAQTAPGSFITDPVPVDFDIGKTDGTEMITDVVYYGTVEGDMTTSYGKMHRIVTKNELPGPSSVTWTGNTTLIDIQQPIAAAVNIATDIDKRLWVYFGTGRYYSLNDADQKSKRSFFGIKEPIATYGNGTRYHTWGTVLQENLFNSTQITISNGTCSNAFTKTCVKVTKDGTTIDWDTLEAEVKAADGWRQDFVHNWERSLVQAAVYGGVVMFSSFIPSTDVCDFGGSSKIWALNYGTGTANYAPIIGTYGDTIITSTAVGAGMITGVNISRTEDGTVIGSGQNNDGNTISIEINPLTPPTPGVIFWRRNLGN